MDEIKRNYPDMDYIVMVLILVAAGIVVVLLHPVSRETSRRIVAPEKEDIVQQTVPRKSRTGRIRGPASFLLLLAVLALFARFLWEELQRDRIEALRLNVLMLSLMLVLLLGSLYLERKAEDAVLPWFLSWLGGLSHELAGALIVSALFLLIVTIPEHYASKAERKDRLIFEMGSRSNSNSVQAVEELRREGWLTDGTLESRDFSTADLSGANLRDARLRGANLSDADLSGAILRYADLRNVNLFQANFESADLVGANLEGAFISGANFSNADLSASYFRGINNEGLVVADPHAWYVFPATFENAELQFAEFEGFDFGGASLRNANLTSGNFENADFKGVDLQGAILCEASFEGAVFDANTVLPDSEKWNGEDSQHIPRPCE